MVVPISDSGLTDVGTQSELRNLAVRYASAVDHRDPGEVRQIFADTATLVVQRGENESSMSGLDEIGKIAEVIARYEKTFHMLGQSSYQVDGDSATGEVYCVANHLKDGSNFVMYIRYEDRYVRDPARGWLFSVRRVVVDWTQKTEARAY